MTNNRTFKKNINKVAKAAKKNPTATIAVAAGGGIFAAIGAAFTGITAAKAAKRGVAALGGRLKNGADPAPTADDAANNAAPADEAPTAEPTANNAAPEAPTEEPKAPAANAPAEEQTAEKK